MQARRVEFFIASEVDESSPTDRKARRAYSATPELLYTPDFSNCGLLQRAERQRRIMSTEPE